MASGLDAVHARGAVHRDIKPSNVMLLPGGRVKLMDFGVARAAGDPTMTQTGAMVGSPAYMAPELINGQKATPAADIWALGVLLYEMLAARPPFAAEAIAAVLYQITHGQPAPLPGVPSWSPPCCSGRARPVQTLRLRPRLGRRLSRGPGVRDRPEESRGVRSERACRGSRLPHGKSRCRPAPGGRVLARRGAARSGSWRRRRPPRL